MDSVQLTSVIFSVLILTICLPIGTAGSIYSFSLLKKWRHHRIRNFYFLVNLAVSCFLTCTLIIPSMIASILAAATGGDVSGMCMVLLISFRVIYAETLVNVAAMPLYQLYVVCQKNSQPVAVGFVNMILTLPWSIGLAYGVVTSLWWCSTEGQDMNVDPIKACRVWEVFHSKTLSGEGILKIDRLVLLCSLLGQLVSYMSMVFHIKKNHEVVRPYELDNVAYPRIPEIEETVQMQKEKTVSVNRLPAALGNIPQIQQSSISTVSHIAKTSTQMDKTFRFRRSLSMREINTGFGSRKNTRTLSRGMSDTELRRMIPGYVPEDFNKSNASTETDQENPQVNRFVQSWKKLQVPYKSNNGNSISSGSGGEMLKDVNRLGVGGFNECSESSVSIGSFRTSGTSNRHSSGTISPYSLRLPGGSTRSFHSFSTSISSEAMGGYFRPHQRKGNAVPHAWMSDGGGAASHTSGSRDAATSTKELEDFLEGRLKGSQLLDVYSEQGRPMGKNSYIDTWRKMSSQTRSTMSNSICHDQLSSLEKIKQWRTASEDCSTIIMSELEESAFLDLCFSQGPRDSSASAFDNIRSVSQICPQQATPFESFCNVEEESTNKAPLEIRVIRPSATSGVLNLDDRLLKRKTGLINQSGTTLPEAIRERNSGSTCANTASIHDACYDADGEDCDVKQKLSLTRKEGKSISISSVDLQAATNSTTEQSKNDTETHKGGDTRHTTGTGMARINRESSSNITRSTQTTSVSKTSQTDSYVRPYLTGRHVNKLVRLNSRSNMRLTQMSSSHHRTQGPRPTTIPERPVSANTLLGWSLFVILVMAAFMLPQLCYIVDVIMDGDAGRILVLDCIPYVWFAIAPYLFIIYKRAALNIQQP